MIVCFLHVGVDPIHARLMAASVRRWMPIAKLVQLTDEATTAIDGCEVRRLPLPVFSEEALVGFHLQHLVAMPEREFLQLDTDVIVQADLSPIFGLPFDMALTRQHRRVVDANGVEITKYMPYNTGVIFSRSRQFWRDCASWLEQRMPDPTWFGGQVAVGQIAPRYNVLQLDCENFNYSPDTEDEDVSQRLAVHYKGPTRKAWMVRKWSLTQEAA